MKNSSQRRKSLGEVDLKSIEYTNITEMKKIMKKAQSEVSSLRRTIMKQRKEMKSVSLISHVKDEKFISEKVSSILQVSNNKI